MAELTPDGSFTPSTRPHSSKVWFGSAMPDLRAGKAGFGQRTGLGRSAADMLDMRPAPGPLGQMRRTVERRSHRRDRTGRTGAGGTCDPLLDDDGEGTATGRRLPRQSAVIARHRVEPEPGQGCFPAPVASDKPGPGSRRRFTAKAPTGAHFLSHNSRGRACRPGSGSAGLRRIRDGHRLTGPAIPPDTGSGARSITLAELFQPP